MKTQLRGASETKRAAILDAAMKLFSQYGYRRTSIDDIARDAEIAKGTVYLSFKSKEEIFRALCEALIERSESGAKLARDTPGPIDQRLIAVLEAKFGFLFETVHRSAHAAELMDSKNRLSADLFARSGRRYMKVLREMIEEATHAGELAPSRMGLDASDLAELLVAAAHGIEQSATSPARYHRRLGEIVRVIVAGLSAPRGEVRARD
jgi:TetR/AcrR family transcriptional regulator, regulator of autoinduction and epiphytic fitness